MLCYKHGRVNVFIDRRSERRSRARFVRQPGASRAGTLPSGGHLFLNVRGAEPGSLGLCSLIHPRVLGSARDRKAAAKRIEPSIGSDRAPEIGNLPTDAKLIRACFLVPGQGGVTGFHRLASELLVCQYGCANSGEGRAIARWLFV